MMLRSFAWTAVLVLSVGRTAAAEEAQLTRLAEDQVPQASALAQEGALTPLLQHAGDAGAGFAIAGTTYNTTTDKVAVDIAGEVHLTGRFSLVLRVDNAVSDAARPGLGAAVRLLEEGRHGVAATGYLVYKAEGFSEPEGELEALASVSRGFGAVRAVANVAYGQDPEGNERDGELALGVQLRPLPTLSTGLVARYRDALGSRGEGGVVRDVFAGASATLAVGRFGLSGLAGLSGIETKTSGSLDTGLSVTAAVAAVF